MNDWRLLLTRPAGEVEELSAQLAEHGIFSSSLPLLEIQPFDETPEQRARILELDRYQAVIVVSKPAARLGCALIDRYWPQPPAGLKWFAVGEATAAVLDDYLEPHGMQAIHPYEGSDSEALLALPELQQALKHDEPRVLIIRADQGREFMGQYLRERGVQVDYLPLYRRLLPVYPEGTLTRLIHEQNINAIVISSGQGLSNLITLAADAWPEIARTLTLFVPSARVMEHARTAGATRIINCHGAHFTALLSAMGKLVAADF